MHITKQQLANLLKEAAEAHHEYEQNLDGEDKHWAQWYAEYISEHVPS